MGHKILDDPEVIKAIQLLKDKGVELKQLELWFERKEQQNPFDFYA